MGRVCLPTPCHEARLEPKFKSSDSDTLDLRLETISPPPDLLCPQVVSEETVRYQQTYQGKIDQVNIHIEGQPVLTLKVREAH